MIASDQSQERNSKDHKGTNISSSYEITGNDLQYCNKNLKKNTKVTDLPPFPYLLDFPLTSKCSDLATLASSIELGLRRVTNVPTGAPA